MATREVMGHRPGDGRTGEPRQLGLLTLAAMSVAASLLLTSQAGPVALPPDPAGSLVAASTTARVLGGPWSLLAVVVVCAALVARRVALVAESLLVVAIAITWIATGSESGPPVLIVWLALPLAAAFFETDRFGTDHTARGLAVVGVAATLVWSLGVLWAAFPWRLAADIVLVGTAIVVGRRLGRAITALVSDVRRERAESRAAGVTITMRSALADHLVPGRAMSRLAAGENARALVATDLHSEVMPRLLTLMREAERIGAERLAAEARETGEAIRSVMSREHPIVLEEIGFVRSIESLALEVERRHPMSVGVRVPASAAEPPALVARAGYRATQEWLENVGRHAGARSVVISLRADGAMLDLRIVDDGAGFALDDASAAARIGHMGLARMRSDAQAIGARIEVEPDRPYGTSMRWHWSR